MKGRGEPSAQSMKRDWSEGLSQSQKARLEALASSRKFVEETERVKRVSERPLLAFAFVEEPLPDGIVTIVRLGQPGPLARYAIVSSTGFDDTVMFTAQLSAFAYEMKHEDDQSPVEITVRSDGTTEWVSEQYGRALQTGRSHGVVQDKRRQSGSLLAKLGQIAPRPIPGHGLARIVGVE